MDNTTPLTAQPTRRLLLSLLIALLPLFYACDTGDEPEKLLIPIPDTNFRNELKKLIPNAFDGEQLNPNHIRVITLTYLGLTKKQIASLEGIRYFTALTYLDCSFNELTALDVSKNTDLTILYCNSNQLKRLDVTQNTELTNLWCDINQLTALDVSQNTTLIALGCTANKLTSLDVSNNTALTFLGCLLNKLTALDISKNTALTDLGCSANKLTSLDVSKNTALTTLSCFSNELTKLDISQNTALTNLNCFSNELTKLDISQNTALTNLNCNSNQLTDLDMSGMRSLSRNEQTALSINAGSGGKNPLTTLKVHDNLKNADEIKEAKTNRGDAVKISVYTAAEGATDYTKTCADYNPNADGGGACLDP